MQMSSKAEITWNLIWFLCFSSLLFFLPDSKMDGMTNVKSEMCLVKLALSRGILVLLCIQCGILTKRSNSKHGAPKQLKIDPYRKARNVNLLYVIAKTLI